MIFKIIIIIFIIIITMIIIKVYIITKNRKMDKFGKHCLAATKSNFQYAFFCYFLCSYYRYIFLFVFWSVSFSLKNGLLLDHPYIENLFILESFVD